MANFSHPYAVRLLEAALDDPLGPCLVMEYVPGVTLEFLLSRHRRLTQERVGRLLGHLGHALNSAHDAGIVHRDLKPANLMVADSETPHESIKVMDFGFAGFAAKPHIQLAELTGHGPIYAIGTPAYVSPEMIRGDTVDGRSDLYSVGVILFELLTGRLPFAYDREEKLLAAHVKESPPRFHRIGCAHVNPAVEAVIHLALSKYPNERQQTAKQLVDEFGKAIGVPDLWRSSAPNGYEALQRTAVIHLTPPPRPAPDLPRDPYRISYPMEVFMPERLAAAKIRGFVEDLGGEVLESEPGLIRIRIGVPDGYQELNTPILGWLNTLCKPGVKNGMEPFEVELHLTKPEPYTPRLRVTAFLKPLKDYRPRDIPLWRARCERLHVMLRQYLGAT
jgi:serine/threonine protein kinase